MRSSNFLTSLRLQAILIGLALFSYVFLFIAWPTPPLMDWPNHMARHYLEALALQGAPLPDGYSVSYSLVANLGSDLIVPLLLQFLPATIASALFLLLNTFVCGLGFFLFVRKQSRHESGATIVACLVLPWLLTAGFFSGFLNYSSGVGLAFLATWNYLRISETSVPKYELILHSILVALLFVWHLAAIGTYAILHGSHFLWRLIEKRNELFFYPKAWGQMLPSIAVLIPAAILFAIQQFFQIENALAGSMEWRPFSDKILQMLGLLVPYSIPYSIFVFLLWICAVLVMVKVEKFSALKFDWLHIATMIFLLLYFILPNQFGTTSGADKRVLAPLLVCAIGIIARLPNRYIGIGFVILISATLLRNAGIANAWFNYEKLHAPHYKFIASMPYNSKVLAIGLEGYSRIRNENHLIAWAVIKRNATVSSLFSIPGQQPLQLSSRYKEDFDIETVDGVELDANRIRKAGFDFVWIFNAHSQRLLVPSDWVMVHEHWPIKVISVK